MQLLFTLSIPIKGAKKGKTCSSSVDGVGLCRVDFDWLGWF